MKGYDSESSRELSSRQLRIERPLRPDEVLCDRYMPPQDLECWHSKPRDYLCSRFPASRLLFENANPDSCRGLIFHSFPFSLSQIALRCRRSKVHEGMYAESELR